MNSKQKRLLVILLLASVYMVSYLTRKSYTSVLVTLESLGYAKTYFAPALTANAIAYAVGQIVSGFAADRWKPERLILVGLAGGALVNFLMPMIIGLPMGLLMVVWGLNGVAQAMLWPPMVKLMIGMYDEVSYRKVCVYVCWGGSLGTISSYVVSSLLIDLSWKAVFFVAGTVGALMCVIWFFGSRKLEYRKVTKAAAASGGREMTGGAILLLAVMMLVIVLQGILRDGMEDWTPTMLADKAGLPAGSAILSAAILPVFSMVTHWTASRVATKLIREEVLCAAAFFMVSVVAFVLLVFVPLPPVVTVICAALAAAGAHGVNYCMTCLVPPHFGSGKHAGLVSGLLNCSTYIGSALVATGTAFLMEDVGLSWNGMLMIFGLASLAGSAVCVAVVVPWIKFKRRNRENG